MWELVLIPSVVVLIVAVLMLAKSNISMRFRLRSSNVKYGKTMEQLLPFSKSYPYDPRQFRFIGDPIDGVQFNEDGIVFVEFKTGKSELSLKQAKIKEIVEKKKVEFREMRA